MTRFQGWQVKRSRSIMVEIFYAGYISSHPELTFVHLHGFTWRIVHRLQLKLTLFRRPRAIDSSLPLDILTPYIRQLTIHLILQPIFNLSN